METSIFPTTDNSEKVKSFWNRPGGKFGTIMGIGILTLIGYYVLPFLTSVIWNTVNFGIALVALGAFLYVITNRKFRLTFFYLYEMIMKKMIGVVIELDPFIIAEDYIRDMEKQREIVYTESVKLDGKKEALVAKISEKEGEIKKNMDRATVSKNMAEKADREGKPTAKSDAIAELSNATRQITRLNAYITSLTPIKDNLVRIGDYLTKVHKNSGFLIEDSKNELSLKKDLYKAVTSGNDALNSAMKMFNGDPEKKMLVEQSMEYLKDDIADKLANMKKAISYSSDAMRTIDLDNASFELEGMRMLEKFDPEQSLKLTSNIQQPVKVTRELGTVDMNEYSNLLK